MAEGEIDARERATFRVVRSGFSDKPSENKEDKKKNVKR